MREPRLRAVAAPAVLMLIVALAMAAGIARAADAPAAAPAGQPGVIAAALQPFVDAHRLAGAVVLIAGRDRVLDAEAVGFADVAAHQAMGTDCLFWIASQSKSVTATAFMMLVDEGKVRLDDPVSKYVPQFANVQVGARDGKPTTPAHAPAHAITVREILSHTSGLRFLNARDKMIIDSAPLAQSVQNDLLEPLLFDPGTGYQYSNEGIDTAGLIIQIVSGMPYEKFLQARLFKPLGMKDTTFFPSRRQLRRLAKTYRPTKDKTGIEETPINFLTYPLDGPGRYPAPGGGLFSTAADVTRFCQMLLSRGVWQGRRYLSEAAIDEMTRKQTPAGVPDSYGLGWAVGGGSFAHGGAASTNMAVDTKRGIVTVFMVQAFGFPGNAGEMYGALGKAQEQVIQAAAGH